MACGCFLRRCWLPVGWAGTRCSSQWLAGSLGNALPLNLCDWAQAALIVALLSRNQRAYELGYFWGLGGTLQGVITPDLPSGFPDLQFLLFMLDHAGLIAVVLYLTWGSGDAAGGVIPAARDPGELVLCRHRGHRRLYAGNQLRFPARQGRSCEPFDLAGAMALVYR